MSFYENVFIARQDISSAQAEALAETFSALITEQGGTVTKTEYWGLKSLSFRIKKNRKGHYILLNLDAPSSAVLELERTMRINEDVLRYLTVKVDELEEGPSAMLQNRGDRGERGDRDRGDRDRGDRDRGPRRHGEDRYGDDDRGGRPRSDRAEMGAE
jgi:small subunit ribosomal protein S6